MKKIVYTPGVYDMLHMGHVNVLKRAKLCGDYLIVAVCSDELVKATKGDPIINENWRKALIEELEVVDEVIIYNDLDHSENLELYKVDVFAVGEEFGCLPEHQRSLDFCGKHNINVQKIKRFPGISTTDIKKKIK